MVEGWSSCLSARVHFNLDLLDWLSMEIGWIDVGRWQMFGVYEGVQFSCYHFGGRITVRKIMAPISSFWLQEKTFLSYSALTCLYCYISSLLENPLNPSTEPSLLTVDKHFPDETTHSSTPVYITDHTLESIIWLCCSTFHSVYSSNSINPSKKK